MAGRVDAWMPLYISDYLRDTMHLTTEQHGAYLLLIMASWARGGRLPNHDGHLAGIAKLSPAAWRRHKPTLLPFFRIKGDELVQPRAEEEAEKAQRLSETRRESGSKGGRPRKQTETKPESERKPNGLANRNQTGSQTETPSPLTTHLSEADASSSSDSNESDAAASSDDQAFEAIGQLDDVGKRGWDGLSFVLTARGGLSSAKARSIVGRAVKEGVTAEQLWEIAQAAWTAGTRDPVAYVAKAAEGVVRRSGAAPPSGGITDPSERQQVAWMEDWLEFGRPGWRRHERGPYPGEEGCRVDAGIQRRFGVAAFGAAPADLFPAAGSAVAP